MNESLIQYAWKCQAFDNKYLVNDHGDEVKVFKPGRPNTDAGPDFVHAHVKIGGIEWHGAIEVHLKSSDWYLHNHQFDPTYEPVILHVVWENDRPVIRKDGTQVPVIELKNIISNHVLVNYEKLFAALNPVPCAQFIGQVPEIYTLQMKDAALAQRMSSKSDRIKVYYKDTNHDLEETAYRLLSRNFGFRLNSDAFERLAHVLPIKILLKHADQPIQMEALLFGMAGMLDAAISEPYVDILKREFNFLGYKYGLLEHKMSIVEWKFLRTRPTNFPTLRISQLADFLKQIFPISTFLREATLEQILKIKVKASDYWTTHYVFGKLTAHPNHQMGHLSKENVMINSVAPLVLFCSEILADQSLKDKAIALLESLPSESNSITRRWESLGIFSSSAFDSQALIGQFKEMCENKKCLQCPVGGYIIRNQ